MHKPDRVGDAFTENGVVISPRAARLILEGKNPDAALLYIYIMSRGGHFDPALASRELAVEPARLQTALAFLTGSGLVPDVKGNGLVREAPERPYGAAEIAQTMNEDEDFSALVSDISLRLGRPLTRPDLEILMNIYENLSFPAPVISLLVTHCMDETARKFGPGRRPTLRQVEKEAYIWHREGVSDAGSAESYLIRLEKQRSDINRVARALQITDRPLSQSELGYIKAWLAMGFDVDVIYKAYDRTVINTGALKWSYMDSIIKSWHSKNLHTLSEVEAGDTPPAKKAKATAAKPPRLGDAPAKPGDAERRALEWVKNYRPGKK